MDKLRLIYEKMAEITLARLEKVKEANTTPDDCDLGMVSVTLQLYNAIGEDYRPELFP